ncbi:hypothetical protein [Nocardia amamiensis]|uniref:hypothetical protein n=1 Tax=Nocardia amamiensis TaxID=404578 RepID=UPI0033D42277
MQLRAQAVGYKSLIDDRQWLVDEIHPRGRADGAMRANRSLGHSGAGRRAARGFHAPPQREHRGAESLEVCARQVGLTEIESGRSSMGSRARRMPGPGGDRPSGLDDFETGEVGGEKCSMVGHRARDGRLFVNGYGPTEVTAWG